VRDDPSTLVAIKKFKKPPEFKDGLSMDSIREIKYLQELSHPNIIRLHSVFSSKDQNLNMVLEYLPLGDLEMLIKDTEHVAYSPGDTKAWMGMLARAVWFCHENFVLHRDIKPNNLLIAADGELKLADFGLARSFAEPYTNMTHNVVTIWYRPPELFFGARNYSGAVDVWSMGIVFAELVLRRPFIPGQSDLHQLELIFEYVGTPNEENWPGVSKLPNFVQPEKSYPVRGKDFFMREPNDMRTTGNEGIELFMSMLALDPRKRKTARQILEHKWWTVDPRPTNKEDLPKKGGGEEKMGKDLQRRPGQLDDRDKATDKVARRLDFSSMR
jgi:cyclin-dependent kinase 7